MGGSSKKVTVGYKYYLGMHMILCHGPADRLLNITVDGRRAWTGGSTGGRVNVQAANLFGGEKREGGVSGAVDLEMGLPTQGRNDYLQSQLGSDIPAYRGVVGAVLRQCYLGLNPYLKKWAFRLSRIHKRTGGLEQWYDEKAAILSSTMTIPPGKSDWRYLVVPNSDTADYSSPSFDDSGWAVGAAPFADQPWSFPEQYGFSGTPGTVVPEAMKVWMRTTIRLAEVPDTFTFEAFIDNDATLYVNGVAAVTRGGHNGAYYQVSLPGSLFQQGDNHICAVGSDRHSGTGNFFYFDWRLRSETLDVYDMNPAHIIRECLTDPEWGMGYQETDIDDSSFISAADKLYAEGFGISILWDRQTPIEDFVKEIVRHINAVLYVDRSTGKFSLKLIRGDYSEGSLLTLGPDQIDKVDNFSRPAFGELVNSVTVNYWDGQTGKTASTTAQDTALVQMQGAVIGTTIQYPGCTNAALAGRLASRDLQTLSNPLLSCTVYADRTASLLNIGDVFKLDWPDLLAAPVVMRVVGLAFGDGKTNKVKVTCTEDIFSLPQVGVVAPQPPVWEDPSAPPTPADVRVAMEAPYYELVQRLGQQVTDEGLAARPEVGYLQVAAGRPGSAINAEIYADAGAGYEAESALDFCPYARLSAPAAWDDTLLELTAGVDMDLVNIDTYVQVGDELMGVVSYDAETRILEVKRGILDSLPEAHEAGSVVFFLDEYVNSDSSEYVYGESIGVRVLPSSGSGTLPLASAPTDTVVMNSRAARPYPPADVKVNGDYAPDIVVGDTELTFETRNRLQQTAPGNFLSWFEPSIALEPGVEVAVDAYDTDTDTLAASAAGLTSPYDLVVGLGGLPTNCRLEVFCRNLTTGLESRRVLLPFQYGYEIQGTVLGAANFEPYQATLSAAGGIAPISWSIMEGSLPAGLHLVPGAGTSATIEGVPDDTTGYYSVTIRAVDSNGTQSVRTFEIGLGVYSYLLHFTGAHGATTFPDETGVSWSRSGSTSSISTAEQVSAGLGSVFQTSGSSYIWRGSEVANNLSTVDFSMEVWARKVGSDTFATLLGKRTSGGVYDWLLRHYNSNDVPFFNFGTTTGDGGSIPGPVVPKNTWYHFAVSRRGQAMRAWCDGVYLGEIIFTGNLRNSGSMLIGDSPGGYGDDNFNGQMDEFRLVRGAVQYWDGDFTPPLDPYQFPQPPQPIAINGSLPQGTASTPYSSTTDLTIHGTGPFTVSVVSGALPSGWSASVDGSNVEVSGPGTGSGLYTFTLEVEDSSSNTAAIPLTLRIT